MDALDLESLARALVAPGKGILAADESHPTMAKRLAALGIPNTEESRRVYRQLLLTTPGLASSISGVILFDETIRQKADDGTPFPQLLARQGILPGIKVDRGTKPLAGASGELVTEGLDGLRERLAEYTALGARFAKWRAVITIGPGIPSSYCIEANAHALARYAVTCQEAGRRPDRGARGAHGRRPLDRAMLRGHRGHPARVVRRLAPPGCRAGGVAPQAEHGAPGTDCPVESTVEDVAQATLRCLRRTVPAAVPGVVFLSGGQDEVRATAHLNALNVLDGSPPWALSFSYARALQAPAMRTWAGRSENVAAAQAALAHRARCNSAARAGRYTADLEHAAAAIGARQGRP